MNEFLKKIEGFISPFFSTRAAGLYMIIFAVVIGAATFIENDFGTSAAQKVIFKTWWFELLMVLFGISILMNIKRFRMIENRRWAVLMFHLAIIVILIGAGITRYFGYEGMMHIRENGANNYILSSDTYLNFYYEKGDNKSQFGEKVLFASLGNNNWSESFIIGEDRINVSVNDFIPNPVQTLKRTEDGIPILKIVIAGGDGREEYLLALGSRSVFRGIPFNFNNTPDKNSINIRYDEGQVFIQSDQAMSQMVMNTQEQNVVEPGLEYPLVLRSLYSHPAGSFVVSDFAGSGDVEVTSEGRKVKNESLMSLLMEVSINDDTKFTYVLGKKGIETRPTYLESDGVRFGISYGARRIYLPFYIRLYDFIMERYPGTNSAASYASEVQLVDDRNGIKKDYRIYMNNILTYGGYRFFQSSFDQDEQGTYLSVNHDFWGTWVSYFGYFLLTLGLVLTFFSKRGRFFYLTQKLKKLRMDRTFVGAILIMLLPLGMMGANDPSELPENLPVVSADHGNNFSEIIVQDQRGRMKPMHTLTRELLRKVCRTEKLFGLTADQVILSMYADQDAWSTVPMIKMGKHPVLRKMVKTDGDFARYADFFDEQGNYILQEEVKQTYDLQPIDRGTFEKEIIKVDERVNIAHMIYSGRFFKIIPVPEDPNKTWIGAPPRGLPPSAVQQFSAAASRFFTAYQPALFDAIKSGDYSHPDRLLDELTVYQNSSGADVMPSNTRIKAEVLLNKMNVFGRLAMVYSLLGLAFLAILFITVFRPEANLSMAFKFLLGLVVLGFVFHTIGLGLRWYVSGRAPWSNGYESMIYIGWTTTLAGLLFARRFAGGLAATMVLAGTILLVAQLSYLDPEITPLVPVLRSYWLTIHVSLEAGSYGFLMLGAIIGLINLILMIFLTPSNQERISRIVKEMSYMSEMTLIGGLVMVSVGTYLGGVWANESWGRYWGWDAKETWALVTILVYAFILHMRLIPKMKGLFAFNLATLFGWASVIMTYFGVNYYLSGLHSYAAGDPIPIPTWVYISVICLMVISVIAYLREKKVPLLA